MNPTELKESSIPAFSPSELIEYGRIEDITRAPNTGGGKADNTGYS